MKPELKERRTAELRHNLRNRLSAIRNAVFYLKRKSQGTPIWDDDPRVQSFFTLVEDELQRCTDHIQGELNIEWLSQSLAAAGSEDDSSEH